MGRSWRWRPTNGLPEISLTDFGLVKMAATDSEFKSPPNDGNLALR
jgi:hypothetical protein